MTTEVEFFNLFFTDDMVNDIVCHTNSYANEHIFQGSHQSYAQIEGSWKDVTPDEIRKLIALLLYFGLVRVCGSADKYWSVKSLYHVVIGSLDCLFTLRLARCQFNNEITLVVFTGVKKCM